MTFRRKDVKFGQRFLRLENLSVRLSAAVNQVVSPIIVFRLTLWFWQVRQFKNA
jgi:hypothetical protein